MSFAHSRISTLFQAQLLFRARSCEKKRSLFRQIPKQTSFLISPDYHTSVSGDIPLRSQVGLNTPCAFSSPPFKILQPSPSSAEQPSQPRLSITGACVGPVLGLCQTPHIYLLWQLGRPSFASVVCCVLPLARYTPSATLFSDTI